MTFGTSGNDRRASWPAPPPPQSGSRRTGSRRSERFCLPPSCSLHPLPGISQHRQRVAAGENEIADARATQRGFLLAGPPCQIDMLRAGRLKGLGCCDSVSGIDLVGGTKTRRGRTGGLECGGKGGRIGKALGVERLDAAGLKEALGKGRARGEVGSR